MKKVSKLLMLLLTIAVSLNCAADPVNWRFQIGCMRSILRTPLDKNSLTTWGEKYSLMFGMEIQVPLTENWYIESGANLRFGPETYTYTNSRYNERTAYVIPLKYFDKKGYYTGDNKYGNRPEIDTNLGTFVDIPIRAGWKLKFNDENEFQFSFGPVMIFNLYRPYEMKYGYKGFSVGLSPSVVYKHRALSLGLYYQNPCIYNGAKNRETNTMMFTVGVNFNGRKPNLDKIINVLEVTGNVLNTVNDAMVSYSGTTTDNGGYTGEEDTYQENSSSSSAKSKSSVSNGNSISKRIARNTDNKTYFKYESMVIKILSGDDTVNKKSDIQRKMRQLREKWAKKGDGWDASPYETK